MKPKEPFRAGTVAILGPPNAGKSTLINALIGEPVAIVAPRPQTTRLSVRGVLNLPGAQAVFVDTPGLLEGKDLLEIGMRESATRASREADVVLWVTAFDVAELWAKSPRPAVKDKPSAVVVTKSDARSVKTGLELAEQTRLQLGAQAAFLVSALRGKGLPLMVEWVRNQLPIGEALFPPDEYTDQTLRQSAAEAVREQALMLFRDEVPHSVAVGVDEYVERPDGLHAISATIYVERDSQKGILIGAGGLALKRLGTQARRRIEKIAGAKVFLKLWVKVSKDWKKDPRFLKELGYPSGKAK